MNPLNKYISEGLFDDEDDLLDKKPSAASLNWFLDENNVIFPDENSENLNINNTGELIVKRPPHRSYNHESPQSYT